MQGIGGKEMAQKLLRRKQRTQRQSGWAWEVHFGTRVLDFLRRVLDFLGFWSESHKAHMVKWSSWLMNPILWRKIYGL
jgi:hypothetical protein